MRRLALGVALLVAAPQPLPAQTETAALLRQAQDLYEQLEIERALALLRRIVSPSWTADVTQEQRLQAYTYLGASLALTGMRDSALWYFRGAVERDPFTDLDAQRFTPAQVALFRQARGLTFAVAARPVAVARVDPRTERATFTVTTTHAASLRVELRLADGQTVAVLYQGAHDGVRDLPWNGLLADGHLAPPGRYALAVLARSSLLGRSDSTRVYFTVAQETPSLEDTLPALRPGELLPERLRLSTGRSDLLKGLAVGAGALAASSLATNGQLGRGGRVLAIVVGAAAAAAGVRALLNARHERDLPANVEENNRRRALRAATNARIAQRNAEKIARTVLIVAPAAGVGP